MEDNTIIGLFFDRSEQAIRELDDKYGKVCQAQSAAGVFVPDRPQSLPHAVSCGKNGQAGRRELHRVAGGAGGLSGLAPDCGGGAGGTGACWTDRGLPGNAVPREPRPAHAPVLVLRQLWGDRGADRLIGKERVRPADPYPKAVAALF